MGRDAAHPSESTHTNRILELLAPEYPCPQTALEFRTPFELLVATILSAQSTDARP